MIIPRPDDVAKSDAYRLSAIAARMAEQSGTFKGDAATVLKASENLVAYAQEYHRLRDLCIIEEAEFQSLLAKALGHEGVDDGKLPTWGDHIGITLALEVVAKLKACEELLTKIRDSDELARGQGPYWRSEIDKVLRPQIVAATDVKSGMIGPNVNTPDGTCSQVTSIKKRE